MEKEKGFEPPEFLQPEKEAWRGREAVRFAKEEAKRLGKESLDPLDREIKQNYRDNLLNYERLEKKAKESGDAELEELAKRLRESPLIELEEEEVNGEKKKIPKITMDISGFERDAYLDNEEMVVLLAQNLPPKVQEFLKKYCVLEFNKDDAIPTQSGIKIHPPLAEGPAGKIIIELFPDSFYSKTGKMIPDAAGELKEIRRPNLEKLIFLLGRAIGRILMEPPGWAEIADKQSPLSLDRPGSWEDYVGLYLTKSDGAKKYSPEAYEYLTKLFDNIDQYLDRIKKPEKTEPVNDPNFAQKPQEPTVEEPEERKSWIRQMRERFFPYRIEWVYRETDFYFRNITEFDKKEVARIVDRDESIADRDKRLKNFIQNKDRDGMRRLLLSDSETSDNISWRIHAYLYAFDPLYRESEGEEVTEESYNLMMRLGRISNRTRRHGTKPIEYKKVEPGTASFDWRTGREEKFRQTRYIRQDREKWQDLALDEIAQKADREVSGVAQEAWEHMIIGRNPDGTHKFYDAQERFGLGTKQEPERAYQVFSGNLEELLGPEFARNMVRIMNKREPTYKLDPDQIALIARMIQTIYYPTKTLTREGRIREREPELQHMRRAAIEAATFYYDQFKKDPQLMAYVDFFRQVGERGFEVARKASEEKQEREIPTPRAPTPPTPPEQPTPEELDEEERRRLEAEGGE